jgi:hypothetical protein
LAHSSPRRLTLSAALLAVLALVALVPALSTAAPKFNVDFAWSPAQPRAGAVVTFGAEATAPGGATVTEYRWDLDGAGGFELSTGASPVAQRAYPQPTNVRVRLQVRDEAGHSRTIEHVLAVRDPLGTRLPPVASFTFAPAAPVVNQPVQFTSTATDPDGRIQEQVWDLNGDGNFDNGGGATALRTFSAPGDYVVGLRVTDDTGLTSFDSRTVTVGAAGVPVTAEKSGPRPLSPFPVIRIAGRITPRGTRVRLVRVSAPIGSKVSIRCAGRGCPFKKQVRAVSASGKQTTIGLRVHRLERLLLPGIRVRFYVTKRETIGKYTKFRFRRGKAPVRIDSCLLPGQWTPTQCAAS